MDNRVHGVALNRQAAKLAKFNGKRTFELDIARVPTGWVVTTKVPEGFWDKCKALAIPLKPKRLFGIFPTRATREMARWVFKYGSVLVVLIPDERAEGEYSYGPILINDLKRDPGVLRDESLAWAGVDDLISNAKSRCAMILQGRTDSE